MMRNRSWIVAKAALLCVFCVELAYGVSNGEKVKITGLITGRNGDTLTVRTLESGNLVVVLTDDTKVVQPKGVLKLRKTNMGVTALIPGLRIQVDGIGDPQNRVVANTIKFSKDDLRQAEAIQAGLAPTQQEVQTNQQNIQANKEGVAANKEGVAANQEQIAANKGAIGANQQQIAANQQDVNKRFSELSDYDTKGTATVYFATGSTAIPAKDKASLTELAHNAVNLTGYIIQVKGFADSSGNAAMNEKLSMDRAQAVVAFLLQTCNVPLRHIVAPGAMGEADPAAPNETAQGRAENRRVEVTVLVNRGLAGGL
jgi:outer membrane protein OmpA-like peptidoglycan-associated protein